MFFSMSRFLFNVIYIFPRKFFQTIKVARESQHFEGLLTTEELLCTWKSNRTWWKMTPIYIFAWGRTEALEIGWFFVSALMSQIRNILAWQKLQGVLIVALRNIESTGLITSGGRSSRTTILILNATRNSALNRLILECGMSDWATFII